jgi:hypothetical protein
MKRIGVLCGVIVALGCTTKESGINLGGTGGQGGAALDGAVVDAPVTGDGGGKCNPGAKRALGSTCGCGQECASGVCADGVCCNTQCSGACVSCSLPGTKGQCAAVPGGTADPHGACSKQTAESCGRDGTCNGRGACSKYPAGTVCKAAACSGGGLTPASSCDGNGVCLAGGSINCSPSLCVNGSCKLTCASNDDCAPPHTCMSGSCGLRGLGQSCDAASQCKSGFCADGVCCDSACTGKCSSCGLPPSLGRCTPVGADAPDPRAAAGVKDPTRICADQGAASCGTNGRCDGAGGCQRYPDGALCKDQTCDPATDRWTAASVCTGGACVSPPARGCAPNRCSGNRCGASCASAQDCTAGNPCVNGSCGRLGLGQLCSLDTECGSGFCAQGVCCNSRCDGVCKACNLPNAPGVCSNVAAGGQDPALTCQDQGAESCGTDGTCNGSGACRRYRAGTTCSPATCTDGMVIAAGQCSAGGTCQPGTARDCGGIKCDPDRPQCLSGCTRDNQCIAPNTCQSGKCGQSAPGGPCEINADCKQTPNPQFCVRGSCCNVSSCSGCKTCASGTCGNVAPGGAPVGGGCAVDTANPICGNDGTCDGAGMCKVAAKDTACAPTCQGDSRVPGTCPGSGAMCKAGMAVDCGDFTCRSGICLTTCSGNADCAAGRACVSGACKLAPGAACGGNGDCASDACLGGHCCTAACTADAGCATCDDHGACVLANAGTRCGPATCTDDMTSSGATCDAMGSCGVGIVNCDPGIKCGANGLCPDHCVNGGDCLSGYTCVKGACKQPGSTCMMDSDCPTPDCIGGICCVPGCNKVENGCGVGCKNNGDCSYEAAGKSCAVTCDVGLRTVTRCNASGGCLVADAPDPCPSLMCNGNDCAP